MKRALRFTSGLAVFLMAALFSASAILNLTLGERALPGFANRVLLPVLAVIVLFFSFVGAYLLVRDAITSK
jgi:hypothetical protein